MREADASLAEEVDRLCRELRERYGEGKSAEVPGAADARTLYKALGLDPTKTRPSNEALLRRALKGEPLYRINTLVDALNLCSLRYQLPFGLYDLDRVEPPIRAPPRRRRTRRTRGSARGRCTSTARPVLVDANGPFGNPTSDSARTMITLATRRALVVAYAPQRLFARAVGRGAGRDRRGPDASLRGARRPARCWGSDAPWRWMTPSGRSSFK